MKNVVKSKRCGKSSPWLMLVALAPLAIAFIGITADRKSKEHRQDRAHEVELQNIERQRAAAAAQLEQDRVAANRRVLDAEARIAEAEARAREAEAQLKELQARQRRPADTAPAAAAAAAPNGDDVRNTP